MFKEKKICKWITVSLISIINCNFAFAKTIINVDDDGPADFNNIQAAIDGANDRDIILIADGTYTGNGNRDIKFNGKAITVKSENGPENCIIDCQGTEFEQHRGFIFESNEDANSVLSGLTITNGYADFGGGIYCFNVSPVMNNLVLTRNTAFWGGAIYVDEAQMNTSVNNCLITGNRAIGNPYNRGYGGGICISGLDESSWFGCSVPTVFTIIQNCTIANNIADLHGGGICIKYNCDVTMNNCVVWGNSAEIDNNIGIYCFETDTCNPFSHVLYSDVEGGFEGIDARYYVETWQNNINTDPCFADPGYWDTNGTLDKANDDFWVDGDYHLKSQAGRFDPNIQEWVQDDVTSPCIDTGDQMSPIGYEPFPNGGIINMGAYGGTAEASKSYFGESICEAIIAGDINGDCRVDFADIEILLLHWLNKY